MPMMTSSEPSYTGTRECRCSRSAGRISSAGLSTSRQNMSVRGTITDRTSVSSSSKTLWIISRSSRSTTPSLAPTSTSVRSSSSVSSGPSFRSWPASRTVSAVRPPRARRTGASRVPSQPTGRCTNARKRSGYFTASVIGSTSPKVVRIRMVPMICTARPRRWPNTSSATSAASAEALMLMSVIATSSVTSRSCGRSISFSGAVSPAWRCATRRSRARPSEKYAASAPVRIAEQTRSAPRTSRRARTPSDTRAPRHEVLEAGADRDLAPRGVCPVEAGARGGDLADRAERRARGGLEPRGQARVGVRRAREQELVVLPAAGGPGERVAPEGRGGGARAHAHGHARQVDARAHAALLDDVAEVGGEAVGEVDHRRHAAGRREPLPLADAGQGSEVRPGGVLTRLRGEAAGRVRVLEERQARRRAPQGARDRDHVAGTRRGPQQRRPPGLAEDRDVDGPRRWRVARAPLGEIGTEAAAFAPEAVALEAPLADQRELALPEVRRGIPSRIGVEVGHQVAHLGDADRGPGEALLRERREHRGRVVPEPSRQRVRALGPAELLERGPGARLAARPVTARTVLAREHLASPRGVARRLRRHGKRGQRGHEERGGGHAISGEACVSHPGESAV